MASNVTLYFIESTEKSIILIRWYCSIPFAHKHNTNWQPRLLDYTVSLHMKEGENPELFTEVVVLVMSVCCTKIAKWLNLSWWS